MAQLGAGLPFHGPSKELPQAPVDDLATCRGTAVNLLELVPVNGIGQEIGKVLEQVQSVTHAKGGDSGRGLSDRAQDVGDDAMPEGTSAAGGIDAREPVDLAGFDGPDRHLVRCVPIRGIAQAGDGEAVSRVSPAVTQDAVHLAQVVGLDPWTVIPAHFDTDEQVAVAQVR